MEIREKLKTIKGILMAGGELNLALGPLMDSSSLSSTHFFSSHTSCMWMIMICPHIITTAKLLIPLKWKSRTFYSM